MSKSAQSTGQQLLRIFFIRSDIIVINLIPIILRPPLPQAIGACSGFCRSILQKSSIWLYDIHCYRLDLEGEICESLQRYR